MAYAANKEPLDLTALTTLEAGDGIVVGDASDAAEAAKYITKTNILADFHTAPTFTTSITTDYLTASEIVITNGSKALVSAPVATYPSLTELTYVKGVTSAIQTQMDAKQAEPSEGAFVDGDKTKLDAIEASADVTDTANVTSSGALMDSELTDIAAVKTLADASIATTDTGTSTTEFVTPDGLQGSIRNLRFIDFDLVAYATAVATDTNVAMWQAPFPGTIIQDDSNKDYFAAYTAVAGTTGTMVVDIHKNGTTIMTTNKLDIETTQLDTTLATTQPDLTTTTFVAGDVFTVDIDAIHTTPATGLKVRMAVRPD